MKFALLPSKMKKPTMTIINTMVVAQPENNMYKINRAGRNVKINNKLF